jgi:hypothetical protein
MGKLKDSLIDIQSRLKAPKGQYNSFGKYKYRNCEDILEAVKPLLRDNGCYLTITDEVVSIGDRYYVKAIATLTDGEEKIEVSALAREEETKKGMDASQVTGATSSYARKYALNGLFCIDDTKDADSYEQKEEHSLSDALREVGAAKTIEQVTKVWNKYKEFQSEGVFRDATARKGGELKNA